MIPTDNIFNIYYDIGRALPFEVQRLNRGANDWYVNQSVLVTIVFPKGKYGDAFGFYLQNGERADSYWCTKEDTEPKKIPCCGCGGWALVRVIGEPTTQSSNRKKVAILEPDDVLSFGKYKGRKVVDVFFENPQYLQWAERNVYNFLVNWSPLLRIHKSVSQQMESNNSDMSLNIEDE